MPLRAESRDGVQQGYLVIADISGYTEFVSRTELEHARDILHELCTLLIEKLSAPFRFAELEGDAVFVFAPEVALEDSERLLEVIEVCYASFRIRTEQMAANTICDCRACQSISSLDLKCVAHFGSYALQDAPERPKPIGPDVILVHRLLKNSVTEETGIAAYALLTEAFVGRALFGEGGLGLQEHVETYEGLGEIECRVLDLGPSVGRHWEAVRRYLESSDADLEIVTELPAPRSLVWAYHLDPERRLQWQRDTKAIQNRASESGRAGIGWASHCDHGSYRLIHRVIDWRPFEFMSMETLAVGRSLAKPPSCFATFDFREMPGDHCAVTMRLQAIDRGWLTRWSLALIGWLVRRQWRDHYLELARLLRADMARADAACRPVEA